MKTLAILFLIVCCVLASSAQQENRATMYSLDEVEVSPPHFTGIKSIVVEKESHFNNLRSYLNKNMVYPEKAQECMAQGTEVVSFEVTPKGEVTNIKVVNSVCPEIDEEVVRALEATNGMWKPGIRDGKLVTMPQEISLVFAYNDNIQHAAKVFKKRATAHFKSGTKNLLVKQNFKRAEKCYSWGMNYLPYDKSLLLMRGLARYENGNHEGAFEDWERLKSLGGMDMQNTYYGQDLKALKGYEDLVSVLKE